MSVRVLSFPMQLCECLCVYANRCVSTMQDGVGFERLSSEVGKGLRASAGSPVITADVKCLQRDGGAGGGGGHRHSCFHSVL